MNILLLETIADEAFEILKQKPEVNIFEGYNSDVSKIINENRIDAIITRGIGQVNKKLLDTCAAVRVVARCGVGLDNVDVHEATKRKIPVVNAPGSNANTVAEHAIMMMLMLQRNVFEAINDVKNGNWGARSNFKSDETGGKTLGILGLGNIGSKVANIASALGMNVIYWSKTQKDNSYQYVSKEYLFQNSDIISLHLPINSETENLINTTSLALMKPSAIIINTARAGIINQDAVLKSITENKIKGYAADVPMQNPPQKDDLFACHPKVFLTAHISSLTKTTYVNMCVSVVKNVLAILENGKPDVNCVFNRKELGL